MNVPKILSILTCLLLSFSGFSQSYQFSTTSKKAIDLYLMGDSYYQSKAYDDALLYFMKAIKKESAFIEAYASIAEIYTIKKEYDLAILNYQAALSIPTKKIPELHHYLGELYIKKGLYAEALEQFNAYLASNPTYPKNKEKAAFKVASCQFAVDAIKNPVPFNPINLGDAINTAAMEYHPRLTVDDETLLFTRHIPSQNPLQKFNEDLFVSYKVNNQWGKAINLGMPINSPANEGSPSLSADGNTIVFAACVDIEGGYGPNRRGYGSCDLFLTKKEGEQWKLPDNMGGILNTKVWESQPSLSADGKTLYFIRGTIVDRERQQDIYVTELNDEGQWSTPVGLSETINTKGKEESVFIHPDGNTLYFSSDGHPGMGGVDLFVSKKDTLGQWSTPINLGYPINTQHDENGIVVSSKGDKAYFASNREGGMGQLDIYSFDLPNYAQPTLVHFMKGNVFDKETKRPVEASFSLIDLATGQTVITSYSDKKTGNYLVSLPINKNYALSVSSSGYLFYSESFEFKEPSNSHSVIRDVPMQPIKLNEVVVLKNIFFETGKYNLKDESLIELAILWKLLTNNPSISIEISGHTDDVGDATENETLSTNRAKAVFDYLLTKGIAPERLSYKGYGENNPIKENTTDEGRAQNRRTEFKIIGIK